MEIKTYGTLKTERGKIVCFAFCSDGNLRKVRMLYPKPNKYHWRNASMCGYVTVDGKGVTGEVSAISSLDGKKRVIVFTADPHCKNARLLSTRHDLGELSHHYLRSGERW